MVKQKRRIYCKFCDYFCYTPEDFVSHLEKHHDAMIPEDMSPWQFSYYLRTGKTHGNCIMCKKDTSWNEETHKYNRFCKNPKCKEKYREVFKNRMIGKYGKTHLLNDPEQQKKMLANRKISGEYLWRDHITKTTYTGSYEKSFLIFLDEIMNFDPSDIMAPSPHTYFYEYQGEKHFYIPDFFIPSLDLEIEIKDGGDNVNQHPKIQAVDKVKEKLKDDVMMKNHFNYIKITNQDNQKFLDFLSKAKLQFFEKIEKPIYMVEKEMNLDDLNEIYTESTFDESTEKSSIDKNFKKKTNGNFEFIDIHDPKAKKYLDNNKYYNKNFKKNIHEVNGEIAINTDDDKLAGYIYIGGGDENKNRNYGFIQTLKICKEYRGYGLSNKLVEDAIKKYNAIDLTCYKDNEVALELYKKHGFVIIGYGNDKNNADYWMKLKSKLSKDDKILKESVDDLYTESLDTRLTTNPFKKEITLFHGSDKKLDSIRPMRINVGNKLDNHARLSSFWSDNYEWCKYWAIGTVILNSGCHMIFNRFCKEASKKYNKDFVILKDDYEDIKTSIKNESVFIYTKTIDKKYIGRGHTPAYPEYTVDIPVKPDKVDEFKIKDIMNDFSYEFLSKDEYKQFMDIVKDDMLYSKRISQFYKYNENDKRAKLKKMKELNQIYEENVSVLQETHWDTLLTRPEVYLDKSIKMYHYSNSKKDIIIPMTVNSGNKLAKPRFSSWWTPIKTNQAGWVLMNELFTNFKEHKWKDITWTQEAFNGSPVQSKIPVGVIGKSFFDKNEKFIKSIEVYQHEKNFNGKDLGRGREYSVDEFTCDFPVKPDKVTKLTWDDIKDSVRIVPDEELDKYAKVINNMQLHGKHLQDLIHEKKPWLYWEFEMTEQIRNKYCEAHGIEFKVDEEYFRYTYNGVGIYEALKQTVGPDIWRKLIKSSSFSWLPKPEDYGSNHYSYFTIKGRDQFLKKVLPICKKYLGEDIKVSKEKNLTNIVYKDKYQVIVKEK